MNAQFEKWYADEYPEVVSVANMGGVLSQLEIYRSGKSWQAAIQSLEVTPQLAAIGFTAFNNEWIAYKTPHENRLAQVAAALTAVLSALKEQAK
jgi:hypothetical protein